MSLAGISFWFWRFLEIVTLLPTLSMLAYFVHAYVTSNVLTPNFVLVLFITSVLAAAWAIATLLAYANAPHSSLMVAAVDLLFVGAFIASSYELRGICNADCTNFTAGSFYFDLGVLGYIGRESNNPWSFNVNKNCSMLKASFVFGIMNCIFFAITAFLAMGVAHHHRGDNYVYKERHVTRRGHRRSSRHSSSPRRSYHSSHRYHV